MNTVWTEAGNSKHWPVVEPLAANNPGFEESVHTHRQLYLRTQIKNLIKDIFAHFGVNLGCLSTFSPPFPPFYPSFSTRDFEERWVLFYGCVGLSKGFSYVNEYYFYEHCFIFYNNVAGEEKICEAGDNKASIERA